MDANSSSTLTRGPWLIGSALSLLAGNLLLADVKETDALPQFESYIKVTGYTADIDGKASAYARQAQAPADGAYGIEDLHASRDLNKNTVLVIDGRALSGSEDYLAQAKIERYDVASFTAGYKRYRTFYDGIGGFFPLNNRWFALRDRELHTDRGTFFVNAKLLLPDAPAVEFSYKNELRSGEKDSTIWGDTNLTGLPTTPANNATRKITASYINLNERHQTFELSASHKFGNTTALLRLARENVDNLDTRFFSRYPGEVTPNPERNGFQRDGMKSDSFVVTGTATTEFSDRLSVSAGVNYHHIHTNFTGDRANAVGVIGTYDFKDLVGRTRGNVVTANLSATYKPNADWIIQPALRAEDSYITGKGAYTRVTASGTNLVNANFRTLSRVMDRTVTPEISARYTGIKRWVLYSTVSDRLVKGDDKHTDQYSTAFPTNAQLQSDDINQDQAKYVLGANWNHSSFFTLRSEVFYKDHTNKFIGYNTQMGSRYVVGYQFTGVKLTAIVKPLPTLSFTTRYQPQQGDMQVTTDATAKFDSMKARAHLLGETIDWNPTRQIFVQLNANVAYNYISTAYPRDQAALNRAPQRNADNNYWSGSAIAGYSLDKVTDVQLLGTYQKADNFEAEIAQGTQPYGAAFEEYSVAVEVKRKLTDRLIGNAKVGYIHSENSTAGGNADFDGPLAYVSLEYSL